MNLLNEITIKNLKLNKRRSVMTTVGIALSVALIFTVLSMILSLRNAGIQAISYERGDQDIQIVDGNKYKKILTYNKDVKDLKNLSVLGYSQLKTRNEYMPYLRLMALEKKDFEGFNLELLDGRLAENSSEIVISEKINKDSGKKFKLGSNIKLSLAKRTLDKENYSEDYGNIDINNISGRLIEGERLEVFAEKEYKLVGIIKRPNQAIESYDEAGYSAFTMEDGTEKVISENIFYKLVNSKNLEDHIKAVYGGRDTRGLYVYDTLIELKNFDLNNQMIRVFLYLLIILISIIVITSVLIIRNSFSISIVERTKEFGVLKSLGATDRQIKTNIIFEGLVLGSIGSLIGLGIGALASKILFYLVNRLLNVGKFLEGASFEFPLSFPIILMSLALGFVTIIISSNYVARKVYRLSPIQAIRSSEDIKISKRDVKSPKYIEKIFGISGLISYKNLRRNRRKYRTTIVSLALSVAVFIGMFSFVDMMRKVATASVGEINYQIVSMIFSERPEIDKHFETSKKLGEDLLQEEDFAVYRYSQASVPEESLAKDYILSLAEGGYTSQDGFKWLVVREVNSKAYDRLLKMNKLSPDSKALLVNKAVLKNEKNKSKIVNILEEDELKLYSSPEHEEDGYITLKVEEIDKILPGMDSYNTGAEFTLYVRENSLEKDFEIYSSQLYISSENPDQTFNEIEDYLNDKGIENFNLFNLAEQVRLNNSIILLIQIFGYGFIGVISLIGLTNVFNTITSNIYSRKREFGSLLSFGMTDRQLAKMSLFESFMIGAKALVWGIPFGTGISLAVHRVLGESVSQAYQFPLKPTLISILTVFLITLLIMNYSLSKIRANNIIESIRNENI